MKLLLFASLILICGLFVILLYSQNAYSETIKSDHYIVAELFTSQGCSSCPPADKVLASFASHDNIIALGFHVAYWDHIGWKDTLSREFSDIRQHGYANSFGTKRVYTPQMIVNGEIEFVGSRKLDAQKALNKASKRPIRSIMLVKHGDVIQISLPEMDNTPSSHIWAFGYKKEWTQNIKRGENHGKSVRYVNSVLTYDNIGRWNGQPKTLHVDTKEGIDGIAVLVQNGGYGQIIAAGKIEF
tara:strand:+ start:5952 stop:6677 length:726 start_codon:yes stop_codon:yes gene_type:complete